VFEGRMGEAPSMDVVAFRDRLEEATYSAREKRGTAGSAPAPRAAAPQPQAAPVVTEQANAGATTAPLQAVPAQPAPQQGFQPVGEGEVRTESLDGN